MCTTTTKATPMLKRISSQTSIEVKSFHNQHIMQFLRTEKFHLSQFKEDIDVYQKGEKEDKDDKNRRKPRHAIHKYEMEESDFIIYLT